MKHNHRLLLYRYAIIFKILKKIPWIKRLPIMYISGSEALPPPLTNEEENDLLFRLEQGDASVKSTLIERNLRLVVYIARKFENTGIGVEDLVSIGTIGLIKAVNTFDPSKRIKLATYASRCIENEILMYLRRNCKIKSEISFDEPLNIDWDGNELLLSDILGTENDLVYKFIEDEVEKELLCIAMNKLSKRERRIMELDLVWEMKEKNTKRGCRYARDFPVLYIKAGKRIIKRLKKEINRMV